MEVNIIDYLKSGKTLLLADGGSTKIDWLLVNASGVLQRFETDGINVAIHGVQALTNHIKTVAQRVQCPPDVAGYYGAGVTGNDVSNAISQALARHFNIDIVQAGSDMLLACMATSQHKKALVSILGTGSNSAYYDGERVVCRIPSLGYVLGDEGSASWTGKKILRDYLRGSMPDNIKTILREKGYDESSILRNVYRGEMPNRYIANAVKQLATVADTEYVQNILYDAARIFFTEIIDAYAIPQHTDLHFCGGMSVLLAKQLRQEAQKRHLKIGTITARPLDAIIETIK